MVKFLGWGYNYNIMENERRHAHRYGIRQLIGYDMGREQYIRAQAVDISRSGLAFISNECVDPLISINVIFSISDGAGTSRTIESSGYVVNVVETPEGCRFGVTFSRMDADDREALEVYLSAVEQASGHLDEPD